MTRHDLSYRIVFIVGILLLIALISGFLSISHNLHLLPKRVLREHYVACSPAKYTKKIQACNRKKKCPMSFECTLNEHNQRKCRWNRGYSNCNYSYDRCGVPGVSS